MNRKYDVIPNHDREAVSEALEAALYRAAFQRLEESEMKKMMDSIKSGVDPQEAIKNAEGTYGRFEEAVKKIDPRKN